MSRIRSIHPPFFTDDRVLSCSIPARMLFIGLWTEADCQGIFEWRPVQLKVRLLPMDAVEVVDLLAELVAADLIKSFSDGGQAYGAIKDFRRYQRPKNPSAAHPLPQSLRNYVAIDRRNGEATDDEVASLGYRPTPQLALVPQASPSPPAGGGENPRMEGRVEKEEEKGEGAGGGAAPRQRGARLPDDWVPSPSLGEYGAGLGFTPRQVGEAAERFRLHWHSSAGRNATKLDWDKAFQGWLRDDRDRKGLGGKPAPKVGVW